MGERFDIDVGYRDPLDRRDDFPPDKPSPDEYEEGDVPMEWQPTDAEIDGANDMEAGRLVTNEDTIESLRRKIREVEGERRTHELATRSLADMYARAVGAEVKLAEALGINAEYSKIIDRQATNIDVLQARNGELTAKLAEVKKDTRQVEKDAEHFLKRAVAAEAKLAEAATSNDWLKREREKYRAKLAEVQNLPSFTDEDVERVAEALWRKEFDQMPDQLREQSRREHESDGWVDDYLEACTDTARAALSAYLDR